ncbi:MAG: glycosyltransferase [Thermodesulfobacteriota bacterium]
MKVLTVNFSDTKGGAARAAYRIHHALRRHGIDSIMCVNNAETGDWTVNGPSHDRDRLWSRFRSLVGELPVRLLRTSNQIIHSPSILSSAWREKLNKSDAAIVHLHWVNAEMLSVADIGQLRKPAVWTLHDMWAFCGAEHYADDFRWRDGYTHCNRPTHESGFDLNRWVWRRKVKHWKHPIHIISPSQWLADCARQSALVHDWPISVIPNAIDTDSWRPIKKSVARNILRLPPDVRLIMFGAIGGSMDPRKGFDLLRQGLMHLAGEEHDLHLLILGQLAPRDPYLVGFPSHFAGHLYDDLSLCLYYCAADVMVIPSRQENLSNAGVEALACGTPVVAFNICGMPDIVQHEHNGYLARPFDTKDLAYGIRWVLQQQEQDVSSKRELQGEPIPLRSDSQRLTKQGFTWLSANARSDALARFSYPVVAERYARLYASIL